MKFRDLLGEAWRKEAGVMVNDDNASIALVQLVGKEFVKKDKIMTPNSLMAIEFGDKATLNGKKITDSLFMSIIRKNELEIMEDIYILPFTTDKNPNALLTWSNSTGVLGFFKDSNQLITSFVKDYYAKESNLKAVLKNIEKFRKVEKKPEPEVKKTDKEPEPYSIGSYVSFKSDVEQTGKIVKKQGNMLTLSNPNGFQGDYIGGQTTTVVHKKDTWIE